MRRVDDLELDGLKLIQDTDMFCFGIDAVMLSNFAIKLSLKYSASASSLCFSPFFILYFFMFLPIML